jgi:DNA end-binding protein Ku
MSPRSIGNHNLNMGMVSAAVQFMTAIDDHDRKASNYHFHPEDGTYNPVKQPKVCQGCGAAFAKGEEPQGLEQADCSSGYAHEGEVIIITPDEKKVIAANSGVDIEITKFVKEKQVDPLYFSGENCYYLVPDMDPKRGGKLAAQKYRTIMQVLSEEEKVGVVEYTKWGKTRSALLRVVHRENGDVLMVQNMLWPDELRAPEFPQLDKAREIELDPRLLPTFRMVAESMTEEWDPSTLHDIYQEKLTAAIEAKAGGKPIEVATVQPKTATDDMDALLAQLQASVKPKDDDAKAPAKKAPAKKAPAKKAAPKKVVA